MTNNRHITSSKMLLVEGIEDLHLFSELMKYMEENEEGCDNLSSSVQLWNYDGGDNLKHNLTAIKLSKEYNTILKMIAITSDAEEDAARKFQSITTHLRTQGYTCPSGQLVATESNPSIVMLIIPSTGQGMIEDICLEAVKDDPAIKCVDGYFNCLKTTLPENGLDCPSNMSKAKLQAFLASRKKPNLRLGTAAKKSCFSFDDPAFNELKELIKIIAQSNI